MKFGWLRRTGVVQLLLFIALAAVVVPFGIVYISGPAGLTGNKTLHAEMTDAFGITPGSAVTYRGVQAGQVSSVELTDRGSARLSVKITNKYPIPVDSVLRIEMSTTAGIQAVTISPNTSHGPYLNDGDTIAAPADQQPQQMNSLIAAAATMMDGIDVASMSTTVDEFTSAFAGTGPALQKLVTNGSQLAAFIRTQAPTFSSLLDGTVNLVGSLDRNRNALVSATKTTADFTRSLADNRGVLVYLINKSPAALAQAQQLFDKYRGTFGSVLANLATVEPIFADRKESISTGLKDIPKGLEDLASIVKNGRADFTLVGTQGPVCLYPDAKRRSISDLSPATPNLGMYCPPRVGVSQRGAANAPRPNDLGMQNSVTPGSVSGPPTVRDPALVPNGPELLDWMLQLLRRIK